MKGITPQERLEKWNAAICAQKASGLTIKEWCEQNGINPNTYMSDQPDLRRGTGEVGSLGSGSKADHRGTERGSSGGIESASYVSCHNALAASRSGWGLFTTGRSENGVNIY